MNAGPERVLMRSMSAGAPTSRVTVHRPQRGPVTSPDKALAAMALEERMLRDGQQAQRSGAGQERKEVPVQARRSSFLTRVGIRMRRKAPSGSRAGKSKDDCLPTVAMLEADFKAMESGPPLVVPSLDRDPEEYVPVFRGTPPWMRSRNAEAAVSAGC